MLHRGRFGDRELVGRAWTELIVKNAGTPMPDRSGGEPAPASGLAWYTNFDGIWLLCHATPTPEQERVTSC